jgi:hypothetical protein
VERRHQPGKRTHLPVPVMPVRTRDASRRASGHAPHRHERLAHPIVRTGHGRDPETNVRPEPTIELHLPAAHLTSREQGGEAEESRIHRLLQVVSPVMVVAAGGTYRAGTEYSCIVVALPWPRLKII